MNRSIITATNTVAQLQKQMDIISHNMANIDTTGYKRREASFTDLLFQEFQNQPAARPEPQRFTPAYVRQGVGAKLGQSQMIMAQGAIKSTGRELDTAFTKEGQFYKVQVQEENGTAMRYTRDGAFYLSPLSENEVILVTGNGHPVLDENNQPIHIFGSPKEYAVDANGRLTVTMHNGARQSFDLGVIQINKPQFLEQKNNNLLGLPDNLEDLGVTEAQVFTELNGALREQISIQQRALEQSNVDMAKEMTELLNVQRSYQFNARSITLADQMMGLVNGIR